MKKAVKDMRREYDFSGGIRGKYAAQFRKGTVPAKRHSTVSALCSRRPLAVTEPIFKSTN